MDPIKKEGDPKYLRYQAPAQQDRDHRYNDQNRNGPIEDYYNVVPTSECSRIHITTYQSTDTLMKQ